MLTKNKIKFIRSLATKRERYSHRKFIIEGEKGIEEALSSKININEILGVESFEEKFDPDLFEKVSRKDMDRLSSLTNSPGVIAVADFIERDTLDTSKGKYIILDSLNDPGNLGTIIRIADWYAFDGVICSKDSVDMYNSKVVQASMGSIFRIPIWYEDISKTLESSNLQSYAAVMEGDDFTKTIFEKEGFLVLGSESHGISEDVLSKTTKKITIPRIGKAESLNVSVAAGILCQQWLS